MGAQSVGEIPPSDRAIPFEDAFPDHPIEFAHELHLDERLTLDGNRRFG